MKRVVVGAIVSVQRLFAACNFSRTFSAAVEFFRHNGEQDEAGGEEEDAVGD